jgi:hypothetical protein
MQQRWQENEGTKLTKDGMKSSGEIVEDERDPDVIPQGKKTEKPLNSSSMLPVASNYGKGELL